MNRATFCSLIVSTSLLTGCINNETNLYEVLLTGQVEVADGAPNTGKVHLEFHLANRAGEGELSHPLGEFDRRVISGPGPVRETILYPRDEGSGLVVYGWLDADGDGALCALNGQGNEPAGLVRVSGFPAHELSFSLVLDSPCTGPELLYP
jgi:hypothetical protein